jgi:hypothetical protein
MSAQLLDCALTQESRIALSGPGKFYDSPGDDSVGKLVNKAEGYTSPFERDLQNPLRFEIGIEVG